MKNYALVFCTMFTLFLLLGTIILFVDSAFIGGLIISLSALGATSSLLLYDNERLLSPGFVFKYKWQDDLLFLTAVIVTGFTFIFLFLC